MSSSASICGQRVLVTGASGFVGSHLTRRLLSLGAEVHGVSRQSVASREAAVTWHVTDLADPVSVQRLVSSVRPETAIHLSSRVTGSRDLSEVLSTFQANLGSTVALLVALTGTSCRRVVLAGSLEETDAAGEAPCSPYAAAKTAASSYARMFHRLYSLPVVVARLFMVYGPDQKDDAKLVPYVIQSLLRGQAPRLSSGRRLVDWVFVEDVVEGLIAASTAPCIEGQTIDFGSGEMTSIRNVVDRIGSLLDSPLQPQLGALPDRPMEPVVRADIQRSFELTGWRPATTLDAGLKRTVEWYRLHEATESGGDRPGEAGSAG
jgi:UDP-glucose 4-epimerase